MQFGGMQKVEKNVGNVYCHCSKKGLAVWSPKVMAKLALLSLGEAPVDLGEPFHHRRALGAHL